MFIPRRGTKEGATAGAAFPAAAAVPAEGQAPFLAEPPPFWKPMTVHGPAAWEVGDAPTLPQDALRAGEPAAAPVAVLVWLLKMHPPVVAAACCMLHAALAGLHSCAVAADCRWIIPYSAADATFFVKSSSNS